MTEPGKLETIVELMARTGYSRPTIEKHIRKNSIPRDGKKRYKVVDVLKAITQDQAKDNNNTPSIKQQKIYLECKKLDRENKQAEGLLIEKAVVERQINERFAGLSKQLQALPGAIASRLVKKKRVEIQTILEESLHDI